MPRTKPGPLMLDGLPVLEAPCHECEGRGYQYDHAEEFPCDACDATGYLLTEAGQRVFTMLQHQLKRLLPELRITIE